MRQRCPLVHLTAETHVQECMALWAKHMLALEYSKIGLGMSFKLNNAPPQWALTT